MAQVRAHDEHALEVLDIGNPQSQMRRSAASVSCAAKIQLPQAMIDIAAAHAAGNLRQQIQLLDRGGGRG